MEGLYAKSVLVIFTTPFFFNPSYILYFDAVCSQQGYIWNKFHSGKYRPCRKKFAKENDSSVGGKKKKKDFSIKFSMISETALHFVRYPPFARMIFWKNQHVDGDEYGTFLQWYLQGKTEVRGENPAPLRYCPLQISHREAWDQTRPSAVSTKIFSPNTTDYFSRKSLTCYG